MLFTREPIIETVITARSGFRLVVRNSKNPQEETLVDALEIVSFGTALFYRCCERPKAFLVPVSDYEVSEVRETRLVLKHLAQVETKMDPRSDSFRKTNREREQPSKLSVDSEQSFAHESKEGAKEVDIVAPAATPAHSSSKNERRRERRKQRRRRGGDRSLPEENAMVSSAESLPKDSGIETQESQEPQVSDGKAISEPIPDTGRKPSRGGSRNPMQLVSALIPPPPTLVSDLFRYERIDNEAVRQVVQESEAKKQDPVQQARTDFIEALDFYSSESDSQSSEADSDLK